MSFSLVKSVSMSISQVLSNVMSLTYFNEIGGYSNVMSVTNIYRTFPYVIKFYSPTFVETFFDIEVEQMKKKITSEQLIGIVCGSVGVFFSIIGITIISLKHKITRRNSVDSSDLSSSEDDVETKNTVETVKETQVNFDITEINKSNIDDDWL